MSRRPDLSVVVLTHNSFANKSGSIRHVLAALRQQRGVEVEILVVDNGSGANDRARLMAALADGGAHRLEVSVEHVTLSIAAARNHGARATHAKTIVFLDDDAILCGRQALGKVWEMAQRASHGYGARRLWTPPGSWFANHSEQLLADLRAGRSRALRRHLGGPPLDQCTPPLFLERSFPGHFGFVDRDLFDATGGFPEAFTGYGCEDDAFALLCFLHDSRFGWLGETSVAHVAHPVPARYATEHDDNLLVYEAFLADRGLCGFCIELLLAGDVDAPIDQILLPLQGA